MKSSGLIAAVMLTCGVSSPWPMTCRLVERLAGSPGPVPLRRGGAHRCAARLCHAHPRSTRASTSLVVARAIGWLAGVANRGEHDVYLKHSWRRMTRIWRSDRPDAATSFDLIVLP